MAEWLSQLGQGSTIVIGSLGLLVALRNQHRQLNVNMFIEFSGRFQNLLRLFPTEAWLANRNPAQPLPPPSQDLTECAMYSLQFVADIHNLRTAGYLSNRLWRLWEREIRDTLSGRVFRREWDKLSPEFAYNEDFVEYINALMNSKSPARTDL